MCVNKSSYNFHWHWIFKRIGNMQQFLNEVKIILSLRTKRSSKIWHTDVIDATDPRFTTEISSTVDMIYDILFLVEGKFNIGQFVQFSTASCSSSKVSSISAPASLSNSQQRHAVQQYPTSLVYHCSSVVLLAPPSLLATFFFPFIMMGPISWYAAAVMCQNNTPCTN